MSQKHGIPGDFPMYPHRRTAQTVEYWAGASLRLGLAAQILSGYGPPELEDETFFQYQEHNNQVLQDRARTALREADLLIKLSREDV